MRRNILKRRDALKMLGSMPLLGFFGSANLSHAHAEESDLNTPILIAVEESDSSIGFYKATDGSEVARVNCGTWPHEILVSQTGDYAFVSNFGLKDYDENIGTPGFSISVIDLQAFAEVGRLYVLGKNHYSAPHGLAYSKARSELYVNVESGFNKLLVYKIAESPDPRALSQSTFSEVDLPRGTHNLLLAPDGKSLWTYPGPKGASRVDPSDGSILSQFSCSGPIRGLSYTADNRLLIASANNQIRLVDPMSGSIAKTFSDFDVSQILYSAATPDNKFIIAPAVWESQVLIIDASSGQVRKRLLTGVDPIHVAVDSNTNAAYITHGRTKYVAVVDLSSFEIRQTIATRGGPNGISLIRGRKFPTRKRLRFGVCLPLSGRTGGEIGNSVEGRDLRLGYQYWQELVNAAGGLTIGEVPHEVEIVYRDSRSEVSADVISQETEDLLNKDHVEYLLGTYPSPPNLHCASIGEKHNVPLVTASGAAEIIYNQGYKYVFGIMSYAKAFLEGTLRKLSSLQPQPKSVTFISCDDPAASQDAITTASLAPSIGFRLIVPNVSGPFRVVSPGVIVYPHQTEDFEAVLRPLLELSPDLIVHTGHLPEAIGLVSSARKINIRPLGFAFSVGPALPAFAQSLGCAARNMFGAAMWCDGQTEWGTDRFSKPQYFAKAFYQRFSLKASYLSAGAMACGIVYEDAFRRAGKNDPVLVRDALASTNLDTFYSHIEFDSRGLNVKRPLVSIQLQEVNGDLVQVPIWPADVAGPTNVTWPFKGWQ